jgi:hypothetical protein
MHGIVAASTQADQIPLAPGELRVILHRMRMVDHCGVHRQTIPPALLALVSITPQNFSALGSPALALVVHTSLPGPVLLVLGYHLQAKQKASVRQAQPCWDYRALAITEHWPLSMLTCISALHFQHQSTRFSAWVSGRACWCMVVPQYGQTYRPLLILSIHPLIRFCNNLSSFSPPWTNY